MLKKLYIKMRLDLSVIQHFRSFNCMFNVQLDTNIVSPTEMGLFWGMELSTRLILVTFYSDLLYLGTFLTVLILSF